MRLSYIHLEGYYQKKKRPPKQKITNTEDGTQVQLSGNGKWCSHYRKQYGNFTKIKLPYGTPMPLLSTNLKQLKAGSWRNILPAAVFTITKKVNATQIGTDGWMNK